MESTQPQVLALLLCVATSLTGHSSGIPLSGDATQSIAQLPTNNFLPSELTLSVLVNQMMLVKMLNDSSTTCSLHEVAILEAEYNARQEDAKEELRRSLEMALLTMQNKKEEALHELAEKERQLAALSQSAINELTETKQRLEEELNATRQAKMTRKTFQLYTDSFNHTEAMDACKQNGKRLAVPENEEEHALLLSVIKNETAQNKVYWIGVDDKEEEDVWVDSNTGLPLTFINFNPGQPGSWRAENCVAMKTVNTGWHDYPCNYRGHGYLCEVIIAVV